MGGSLWVVAEAQPTKEVAAQLVEARAPVPSTAAQAVAAAPRSLPEQVELPPAGPVARPGRAAMIHACCDTAPSDGPCEVTLQWKSAATGLTTLATVTIEAGQNFGSEPVPVEVATLPAGAWVRAGAPSPANGASGVDVELTIEPI